MKICLFSGIVLCYPLCLINKNRIIRNIYVNMIGTIPVLRFGSISFSAISRTFLPFLLNELDFKYSQPKTDILKIYFVYFNISYVLLPSR